MVRHAESTHSRYKEHAEEEQRNKGMMKNNCLSGNSGNWQKNSNSKRKKELRRLESEQLQKQLR